jgi:hypothetical protein
MFAETCGIILQLGYKLWLALAWKPCTRGRAGIVAANIKGQIARYWQKILMYTYKIPKHRKAISRAL